MILSDRSGEQLSKSGYIVSSFFSSHPVATHTRCEARVIYECQKRATAYCLIVAVDVVQTNKNVVVVKSIDLRGHKHSVCWLSVVKNWLSACQKEQFIFLIDKIAD